MTPLPVAALAMGFVGSTHCVVMCGGVVSLSCSSIAPRLRRSAIAQAPFLLAFNAGRVASYMISGGLSGWLGGTLTQLTATTRVQIPLRLAAALMTVGVGVYATGFTGILRWAELVGRPIWRRVSPYAQRLVPVTTPLRALMLGLLWGWMPCGLVYAALAAAALAGTPLGGAAVMGAFGLGTLPTLLLMGTATMAVQRVSQSRAVRLALGSALVVLGLIQVSMATTSWAAPIGSVCGGSHLYLRAGR